MLHVVKSNLSQGKFKIYIKKFLVLHISMKFGQEGIYLKFQENILNVFIS